MLAALPGPYAPPDGRFLIASHDGSVVGCIALRRHDATDAEVKRLYVSPCARGLRLGTRLVEQLIEEARAIGYRRIVLDSHITMRPAHEIYRAAGFRDIEAPPDFPEHLEPRVVFMSMDL